MAKYVFVTGGVVSALVALRGRLAAVSWPAVVGWKETGVTQDRGGGWTVEHLLFCPVFPGCGAIRVSAYLGDT